MPHGDRSNVVIEPFLTDQWYVNAKKLAEPAIAAVREGKTNFVPKNWEKTYFNWMENIQPWCISRQLVVGPPDSGVVWAGRKFLSRKMKRNLLLRKPKAEAIIEPKHYGTSKTALTREE